MAKKKKKKNRRTPPKRKQPDEIAVEIRGELRSITRMIEDLRTPLERFERRVPLQPDRPGHYVMFDQRPRRLINGLRLGGLGSLALPDDRITDEMLELAKAVWHLRDHLHRFAKAAGRRVDVRAHAEKSSEMLICADLANKKKHGASENRSKLNPELGLVRFDTSRNGAVELFSDGATNEKELIVSNTTPIPFVVELKLDGKASISDAVEVIIRAVQHWMPLINDLGILAGDDRVATTLRNRLARLLPPK